MGNGAPVTGFQRPNRRILTVSVRRLAAGWEGSHVFDGVTMILLPEHVSALADGIAHQFSEWPNSEVPSFGAGVYTIWHRDGRFVYVGMSGRGISKSSVPRNSRHGIYTRLHSHASGRRSGDQFCVYVADRFVLPTLTPDVIAAIASGRHQMDALVRRYIHDHLLYRYVIVQDGRVALSIEAAIKAGTWDRGRPILNPGKRD